MLLDFLQGAEYGSRTLDPSGGDLARTPLMIDNVGPDVTSQVLIQIRDEMRTMRSAFEARFDSLDAHLESAGTHLSSFGERLDVVEGRMSELFRRFSQIDSDLKRFASLVNETILHYAEEMDRVRERLESVESRVEMSSASD
jgi:archaellum component FlaC